MEHNKDKGTSVGFSNNKILQQFGIDMEIKYGIKADPIDFKIKENLEVIENNKWEDIEAEFEKDYGGKFYKLPMSYMSWLKEKYFAPEKKINKIYETKKT